MDFLLSLLWGSFAVGILVAINAFFVASEFALVSVRRSRIDELVSHGVHGAVAVKNATHDLDRYIAGTQIGITIASLALGWIGEPVVAQLIVPLFEILNLEVATSVIHTVSYVMSFAIITFLHVVLGELVPKSIALQSSEKVALWVGRPMTLVVFLFRPLIAALNGCGNVFLRLIGFSHAPEFHAVHSVEELDILVRQSHKAGVLDDLERDILERTFHFSELSVGAIKTPRTDIDALDINRPIEELLEDLSKSTHTRLPVFDGSIDKIVGIVNLRDVFCAIYRGELTDIVPLVKAPFLVPEGIHLDALVEEFRKQQTKIAIVVDEYGATAGLVTFRDIVEEVFGAMRSSPSSEPPRVERLSDGNYLVRGDIRLDELSREVGWDLADEDVDTLAGLVMKKLGRVAVVGDAVSCDQGMIKVTEMRKLRITKLLLESRPPAAD